MVNLVGYEYEFQNAHHKKNFPERASPPPLRPKKTPKKKPRTDFRQYRQCSLNECVEINARTK